MSHVGLYNPQTCTTKLDAEHEITLRKGQLLYNVTQAVTKLARGRASARARCRMGGGASSPFKSTPVEDTLPRLETAHVGRVVHLVGTVATADGKCLAWQIFSANPTKSIRILRIRTNLNKPGTKSYSEEI